jgi:hypothetical protein
MKEVEMGVMTLKGRRSIVVPFYIEKVFKPTRS